jgi:predicted ester cyclase
MITRRRAKFLSIKFILVWLLVGLIAAPLLAQEDPVEARKAALRELYAEVFNAGKLDVMDELYAEDYVNHGYGEDLTLDDFKATIAAMRAAMPDFKVEIEVLIAEVDWAASRVVFRGMFENEWVVAGQTIEPNDKAVEWGLITLHRFDEDGKLVEDFTVFDSLGLLVQLDASPIAPALVRLVSPPERAMAVMETVASDADEATHAIYREKFTCVIEDAINNGDLDAIDSCMGADHQAHEPLGDLTRDQFKAAIGGFRSIVPDLHVDIDALVIEGNWLAARLNYTGTFTNPITIGPITIEPTNEPVSFIVNIIVHYDNEGVSIEDFKEYNRLGWARQIGLID